MENLKQAYGAVKANNGALGIDGQTVQAFGENLVAETAQLHLELKTGTYKPSPVRRVDTKAGREQETAGSTHCQGSGSPAGTA